MTARSGENARTRARIAVICLPCVLSSRRCASGRWPGSCAGDRGGGEGEALDEAVPALGDELLRLGTLQLAGDPLHRAELGEGLSGPLGDEEHLLEDGEGGEVLEGAADEVGGAGGERRSAARPSGRVFRRADEILLKFGSETPHRAS